jgi:hypothetical protein
MRAILALPLLAASACTTLGPMPVHTGVSPVPADRTEVEAQAAIVPGYFLSSSTSDDPDSTPLRQGSLVFQPGSLLGVRGLFVGARIIDPGDDTQGEPMLGYRRAVDADRAISVVGVVFGTRARGEDRDASYTMRRLGGEIGVDFRLARQPRLEPHVVMAVSATALSADGTYCVGSDGFGVDCPSDPDPGERIDASVDGLYPALSGGFALRTLHTGRGIVHGARVVALVSAGRMPRLENGVQEKATTFVSGGLAVSFALGVPAPRGDRGGVAPPQ